MSRFYNISWREIDEMPLVMFNVYVKAIDIISAEEELRAIKASTFSKLKKEERSKIHQSILERVSSRDYKKEIKVSTSEDMARMLGQWQMKK